MNIEIDIIVSQILVTLFTAGTLEEAQLKLGNLVKQDRLEGIKRLATECKKSKSEIPEFDLDDVSKIICFTTMIVEEVKREEFDNQRLAELIKEFEETLKQA